MTEEQPKRSNINIRPKGQPDAQGYSPHRDLAYVYPAMMQEAFITLDEANWTDEFRAQMYKHGICEGDLAEGVRRFVEALNLFIREPDIKTPADAFRTTEFDKINSVVRNVLWTRFGEVLTGGWFVAVRDVTLRGQMSDAADVMADMLTAGRIVAMGLTEHSWHPGRLSLAVSESLVATERLKTDKLELQRALKQSQSYCRQLEDERVNTEAKLREFDASVAAKIADSKSDAYRARMAESNMSRELFYVRTQSVDRIAAIRAWVSAPFLSRLFSGIGILLKAVFKREVFNVGVEPDTTEEFDPDTADVPTPE
jgi:hypothetical protein